MSAAVVRSGEAGDLGEIVAIYNHYVRSSHVTFDLVPWTIEARRDWFSHFTPAGPRRLLVLEEGGEVVGWSAASEFRRKPAYARSVETTIYLRPDACGRRLGSLLYRELLGGMAGAEVHRAYAAIALPNPGSVALHRSMGFRQIGLLNEVGFKQDRYWDVAWFELRVPPAQPSTDAPAVASAR